MDTSTSESQNEVLTCHECSKPIEKGQAYYPDATFFPPKQTKIHEDCLITKLVNAPNPFRTPTQVLKTLERFRQVRGEEREWTEEDIEFAKKLAKDSKKNLKR